MIYIKYNTSPFLGGVCNWWFWCIFEKLSCFSPCLSWFLLMNDQDLISFLSVSFSVPFPISPVLLPCFTAKIISLLQLFIAHLFLHFYVFEFSFESKLIRMGQNVLPIFSNITLFCNRNLTFF